LKDNKIFLILAIPFIVYIIARPGILYYDSYHYLSISCGLDTLRNEAPLSQFFFPFLPCSVILIKVILYGCCALSVWFLNKTWKNAGYYAMLMPLFLYEFFRWENDTIAYVLMFASVYFFYRSYREKRFWVNQGVSSFLILAACGFWGGALFLPFLLSVKKKAWFPRIMSVVFAYVFGGELLHWWIGSFHYLMAETVVNLAGLYLLPGVLLAIVGLPVSLRKPGWPAIVLTMFKAKLAVLSMIFLPEGITLLVERFPRMERPVLFASIGMIILSSVTFPLQEPAVGVHSAIGFALELSENGKIEHDWDIGYMVLWNGGDTNRHGMPSPDKFTGLAVSRTDQNCPMVKNFGKYSVWDCSQEQIIKT